jgi:hypothetical protein
LPEISALFDSGLLACKAQCVAVALYRLALAALASLFSLVYRAEVVAVTGFDGVLAALVAG